MTHQLKTLPCYFQAVWDGIKTFEIRDATDRGFQVGDRVVLREIESALFDENYTGREIEVEITYVIGYQQKPGWVVASVLALTKQEEE